MKVAAVIPVAGRGKRFGKGEPKQFLQLHNQPVIAVTLSRILSVRQIIKMVVVSNADLIPRLTTLVNKISGFSERGIIVTGGKERQDSVFNGLNVLDPDTDFVLVHDGVRPLVSHEILAASITTAARYGACAAAVPVKDTIKRVVNKKIIETLPRAELWQIQTPQTARYDWLWPAHQKARARKYYGTDEASLLEWAGHPVRIIPGDYRNIKITTPEDLQMASALYQEH